MDVESLRNELEKHLAHNPDADAPRGFRDRFNMAVEQYQAGGEGIPTQALEAELEQIRIEAEAAAKAAGAESDEPALQPRTEAVQEAVVAPAPPAEPVVVAPVAPTPPARPAVAPVDPAPGGFVQRYGVALVVALIVIAAAWYFFFRR